MKHCHFSILYNEIAFLKQKLPFLYQHFDQLIFYDLGVKEMDYSTDGSHEFIKEYPDPEGKITLIEQRDLSNVKNYKGYSVLQKQKMFAVGSRYVHNDMDVFWCTDMDEFFQQSLIAKVEQRISGGSILVPHLVFFKNHRWVFAEKKGPPLQHLPWPRIAAHKPGNLYGHCSLHEQFKPVMRVGDERIFHFSYIGDEKVRFKADIYKVEKWVRDVWAKFKEPPLERGKLFGHPAMHPTLDMGIKMNDEPLPAYIDVEELMRDLRAEYDH